MADHHRCALRPSARVASAPSVIPTLTLMGARGPAFRNAAERKTAAMPAYGNVTVMVQPQALPTAPTSLDLVWTSQNYHDYADPFLGRPGPDALARDAFRLLRPGGYFIVIDHRSAPGRGLADTDTLHRIDPAIVRRQAKAAGFVFAGESSVLVNASDPLTIKVFDPSIRGRTSQFAYAFRKACGVG